VTETLAPLALISIAVLPGVHAVTIGLGVLPLSDVGLARGASPDSIPVLQSLLPLTIVDLSILPSIYTFAVGLVLLVLADVDVSIGEELGAMTVSLIVFPLAFVHAAVAILANPEAMPFSLLTLHQDFALEDGVSVLLDCEIMRSFF
jgi:hypothetical protein